MANAGVIGFLVRDWHQREQDLNGARHIRSEAESLVRQYKDHLAKIHEIDKTRVEKIVEITNRLESVELKMSMAKGSFGDKRML